MTNIYEEKIPDICIIRQSHNITLGVLFSKDSDGFPKMFNYKEREESSLRYRIPEHQRFPRWNNDKKKALIDSIFRNYAIHGIMVSQHIDNNCVYYDLEDGQTRLSVLQEYYNDGFEYCGKLFSQLTNSQQRRFENYSIVIEVLSCGNNNINNFDDDIHEMFERFQMGSPLTVSDRLWNRKDLPIIKYSLELIKSDIWRHDYMGTTGFSSKKRKRLADVCGMVCTLVFGNEFITTSFRRLCPEILTRDEIPLNIKKKVEEFLIFYFDFCDKVYEELPRLRVNKRENVRQFWNLGKELGMILWDYLDDNGEPLEEIQERWVEIINIERILLNLNIKKFMSGSKTLWHGLSSKDIRNTYEPNVRARVYRVREFSNKETREEYAKIKGILWKVDDLNDNDNDNVKKYKNTLDNCMNLKVYKKQ